MRNKKYLEKMAKKFPKLMTDMKPYVHKAWRIRSRKNIKGKKRIYYIQIAKNQRCRENIEGNQRKILRRFGLTCTHYYI